MKLICNLFSSFFPSFEDAGSQREKEREIDASMRFAVLSSIKAAVVWMLLSSILGFACSVKLVSPSYMTDFAIWTYGRMYPAFWNALVYGWLFNAGFACVTWIIARLSGKVVANSYLLTVSGCAWNVATLIGIVGIFKGDQTAYSMLEFPVYAAPFLFVAFAGVGLWIVLAFKARSARSSFATQWHALAAVFSFVWIYTIAQVMLFCLPAQGVFQGVVAAWFKGNLFGLVVAPFAFATVYYMIPKALGQTIVGYRQSGIAFWSWIACTSCSGLASLVNGPFPAWVASVGVIASFALFFPVMIFSMQFISSLLASFSKIWDTISARYVAYGVVAFLVSSLLIILGSLRGFQDIVQFSQYDNGVRFLFLAGFAGMVFTGGMYFILPRLLNKELPSAGLADIQFWIQGLSIFGITLSLVIGGYSQGILQNGSVGDMISILVSNRANLFLSTVGHFIFLCSSLCFAVSFLWMLCSARTEKEKTAKLIEPSPELEYTAS